MVFIVLDESAAHFVVLVLKRLGLCCQLQVFGFEHLNSGLERLGSGRELRVFGLERLNSGLECLHFGRELRLFDLERFIALLVMFDARDASCNLISIFYIPRGASIASRSSPIAPALPFLI